MFQFRDPSAPVSVFYSPGRDVAHVGFDLIQFGLNFLQHNLKTENPNVKTYMEANKISTEEVCDAIKLFIESIEEEIKNPSEEMLQNNKFSSVPVSVRYLIYSHIAPIFIAASIKGKKDVLDRADAVEYYGEEFHKKVTGLVYSWIDHNRDKTITARFLKWVKNIWQKSTQIWSGCLQNVQEKEMQNKLNC